METPRLAPRDAPLVCLAAAAPAWSTLEDWATVVASQVESRQPLPVLSAYGIGLTLGDAYAIQKRVIDTAECFSICIANRTISSSISTSYRTDTAHP